MTTQMGPGGGDMFVAKLAGATGTTLFGKVYGSAVSDAATAITVDDMNNIYVTGYFQTTINFDAVPLTSAGGNDAFVVQLSSAGTALQAVQIGDGSFQVGEAVAWSPNNLYIAGRFSGTVFGLTAASAGDVFLASLDPATLAAKPGAKSFGTATAGLFSVDGIAASAQGDVAITGMFGGDVDFGGGLLSDAGTSGDAYVAKFGPGIVHQWSKSFGDAGGVQRGYGVAIDAAGGVIVAGSMESSADFGGGTVTSAGLKDIFASRYDTNGNFVWAKQYGNASDQEAYGAAVDSNGNVLLTGYVVGTVDFGNGPLVGAGAEDIFMLGLTP